MKSLIGYTPIIKLDSGFNNINLYAKCEFVNPTGSIKDRVAQYIIETLTKNNVLRPKQLIVEASSGNMGTSLAALSKIYDHPVHITCPEKTGSIKRKMIQKFGAKLTVCPNVTDANNPNFYVNKACKIAEENEGYFVNQYDNTLNTECHYHTTGQEIVDYFTEQQLSLDYFITVGGSGGTVTGCAKKIKEHFAKTQVVMPDPFGSVYHDLFYHKKVVPENIKSYRVEGPGNSVFCQSMDLSVIDQVIQFSDEEAFAACDMLVQDHGVFVGHSSGANYHIAQKLMATLALENPINILILLPDSGVKYL